MFRCGGWRFRLTATYFFTSAKKSKQKTLAPAFGPRRLGFLRCGIDPSAAPPVCFAAPPLAVSGCARRSQRSHARINPSTQPSEVARGSRSRAVLELALIVEWGGFAAGSCAALLFVGAGLLRAAILEGGLTADLFLEVVPNPTVGAAAGCDLLIWRWLLLLWGSEPTADGDPIEAA